MEVEQFSTLCFQQVLLVHRWRIGKCKIESLNLFLCLCHRQVLRTYSGKIMVHWCCTFKLQLSPCIQLFSTCLWVFVRAWPLWLCGCCSQQRSKMTPSDLLCTWMISQMGRKKTVFKTVGSYKARQCFWWGRKVFCLFHVAVQKCMLEFFVIYSNHHDLCAIQDWDLTLDNVWRGYKVISWKTWNHEI